VRILEIFINAYPESIASADKYGRLLFYYACQNPASSLQGLMLYMKKNQEDAFSCPYALIH
jgi:hypothetical protein